MGMHRDEILDGETLPRRYMAYTVCFRREAGSAGKDTRGMQRLHEFHKVELVILCREDQFEAEFQGMVADAERPLQRLELPYRVLDLCTSDLTFGAARTYDLEVYAPGAAKWLEVSSVGKYTTFQTRRGNMRYRDAQGKIRPLWAMNGSGLATPRVWAAVVEHGYRADGRIRVPDALRPYVGKEFLEARGR
jgi:seryl-tRNA synthetase